MGRLHEHDLLQKMKNNIKGTLEMKPKTLGTGGSLVLMTVSVPSSHTLPLSHITAPEIIIAVI